MSSKKLTAQQKKIIKAQLKQLDIDLKRGFMPYSILFLIRQRPRYALELQREISRITDNYIVVDKNTVYEKLKKFQKLGALKSYTQKSDKGADRRYYKLTPFGEILFQELTVKHLVPAMLSFQTHVKGILKEFESQIPFFKK